MTKRETVKELWMANTSNEIAVILNKHTRKEIKRVLDNISEYVPEDILSQIHVTEKL